jgi:hypothetical protein
MNGGKGVARRRFAPTNWRAFTWYVIVMTTSVSTAVGRGRPSLSGGGDSPQLRVRVPSELRGRAEAAAARAGISVSSFAREALQERLRTTAAVAQRPEERVQLELHRALLAKLVTAGLSEVRPLALANLARAREVVRGRQAKSWLDEWQDILANSPERLVEVLLGTDEHSIDLRQVSPFAGTLSEEERMAAIRRARSRATG